MLSSEQKDRLINEYALENANLLLENKQIKILHADMQKDLEGLRAALAAQSGEEEAPSTEA